MSTLADRTIQANRTTQDRLAGLVQGLSDGDLSRPSGAAEWTVAQVLSHLGSGAEITLGSLRAAQQGQPPPDDHEAVWARWNAMSPWEQATGFLQLGEQVAAALDDLDADQREQLLVPLGFLPEPADVALFAGMRLDELAMHAWDVEVAADPAATLPTDVADVLLEQFRGPIGFLLGFASRPDELAGRPAHLLVRTSAPQASFGLSVADSVALGTAPPEQDGTLTLPAEALLRLFLGRLAPEHTPDGVSADGAVSLDDLRRLFPGI